MTVVRRHTEALQIMLGSKEMRYVASFAREARLSQSAYGRQIIVRHLLEQIAGGRDAKTSGPTVGAVNKGE